MDIYAVLNATEKIPERLGLRKAGDRLSLQAFCKRETDSCGQHNFIIAHTFSISEFQRLTIGCY